MHLGQKIIMNMLFFVYKKWTFSFSSTKKGHVLFPLNENNNRLGIIYNTHKTAGIPGVSVPLDGDGQVFNRLSI